jgi:fumarate reductase subunit C
MLRESTSLFAVWVSLYLLLGLLCPSTFLKLLNNPIVVLLNLVALAAAVLHTWTWFGLVPKALNLPEACLGKIVKGLWWTTAAVSVIFLLLAIF